MKILCDNQIFCIQKFGGVSRYHIELAKQFVNKFDDMVDIPVAFCKNVYLSEYQKRKFVNIHNYSRVIRGIMNRLNLFYDMMKIRFGKYDVIHLTWYDPRMLKLCTGKTIITVHDMIHEIYGFSPETIKGKKDAIYRADGIIAISESTKNDILKFYPDISENKIEVIYHGTNHLSDEKTVRNEKNMEALGIPPKYLLYVGQRALYKNARFVLENIAEKLINEKDLYFVFVGGGAFSAEEIDLLEKLKIKDKVIHKVLTDDELKNIYQNALCFVYPSLYEGFGFPVLEAFDNQCPVICSNTSSLPEVGGDAALYFSPVDGKDFLEKIDLFLYNQDIREEYIKRGNERKKAFDWEKTAEKTRQFYERIMLK